MQSQIQSEWILHPTPHINQMLRVKEHLSVKPHLKTLLMVKHTYHVADDIMFPDPACLAFFTAFEENHLAALEEKDTLQLVAVDIFEGLMQFYIYCENAEQSVYDCIAFLKSNANYPVEFEIKDDSSWSTYFNLLQ